MVNLYQLLTQPCVIIRNGIGTITTISTNHVLIYLSTFLLPPQDTLSGIVCPIIFNFAYIVFRCIPTKLTKISPYVYIF